MCIIVCGLYECVSWCVGYVNVCRGVGYVNVGIDVSCKICGSWGQTFQYCCFLSYCFLFKQILLLCYYYIEVIYYSYRLLLLLKMSFQDVGMTAMKTVTTGLHIDPGIYILHLLEILAETLTGRSLLLFSFLESYQILNWKNKFHLVFVLLFSLSCLLNQCCHWTGASTSITQKPVIDSV